MSLRAASQRRHGSTHARHQSDKVCYFQPRSCLVLITITTITIIITTTTIIDIVVVIIIFLILRGMLTLVLAFGQIEMISSTSSVFSGSSCWLLVQMTSWWSAGRLLWWRRGGGTCIA